MEYNTQRNKLVIPEYGRNVQNMVEYAQSIDDREARTVVANAIVKVMGQINPIPKDTEDLMQTLWDHLYIISNYTLDVDTPYPTPKKEEVEAKPERLAYPKGRIKYGHYGKTIQMFLDAACELEESEQKEILKVKIANMMKMSYLSWNRDSVNDQTILDQMSRMTNGKLEVPANTQLISTFEMLKKTTPASKKKKQQQYKGKSKKRRY